MERKDLSPESGLKASMWSHNDFEEFACYEKGNAFTRRDAETCLQEYAPRFKWTKNSRVLELGSGDGSVTSIVAKYIPKDCELIGSDICGNVIKYASKKYGNERIEFIQFDVVGEVPEDMKGKFDHVFAMFLFHWVRDLDTAFTNVYNILPKNGEFFTIFLGYCDIYSVFRILAKRKRWAHWMKNIDQFTSPYHESEDLDVFVAKILKKIGFENIDVKCRQKFFIHPVDDFRALITGINAFDVPKNLWSDFVDDYIEVKRYMNLVDDTKGTVRTNYNLLIVHCTK